MKEEIQTLITIIMMVVIFLPLYIIRVIIYLLIILYIIFAAPLFIITAITCNSEGIKIDKDDIKQSFDEFLSIMDDILNNNDIFNKKECR